MSHFNKTLVSTRLTAGYRTAYSFYHTNGGRRVFPFTYAYYLKIERGSSLPRPEWLALIMRTMRILGRSQRARLAMDYLRDLSGASYEDLFAPFLSAPEESPAQMNLKRIVGRLAEHMTPKQLRASSASPEAYGCFIILVSTGNAMSPKDLAESLGSSEEGCANALHGLARAGIAKEKAGGLYQIAHYGRHYLVPKDPDSAKQQEVMHAHANTLFTRAGTVLYNGWTSARLSHSCLSSSMQELQSVFHSIVTNGIPMKADPSAPLYLFECRVRKLVGAQKTPTGLRPRDALKGKQTPRRLNR